MIKEHWKAVVGYEGLYEVSDQGRIRSLNYHRTGKWKIIKLSQMKQGYLKAVLCKNKKATTYRVHRLVAMAFIPNPNNLPEINHINECPWDNRVENLEWCNHKYNCNHGTRVERIVKNNSKQVGQCTFDGKLIFVFPNTGEAARQTGFSRGNIISCCNGNRKTCGGFMWKYL